MRAKKRGGRARCGGWEGGREGGRERERKGGGTREAEDLRGGSKNIENAPLFSGEARVRVYAREAVEHASETEEKDEARETEREKRRRRRERARERESERAREREREREREAAERRPESARTAGADRVYARYDWLDESIVDPLSRSRRGGGTAPTSLTYTTSVV